MKCAIFNPYLDSLGGGERYTMTFAEVLIKFGWRVDVQWPSSDIRNKLQSRFGTDYSAINFIPDIKRGDGYDLCFWVSDGSIPTLRARKNLLHFQVPFHHVGGNNLLNKMKLFRIDRIICNSNFTKRVIDKEYGVESIVIHPPVPVEKIRPKRKENVILSVGRFSQLKQSKHQDILVKAFKKMVEGGLSDWKLVLAGGADIGVGDYVDKLRKMADGYSIEIMKSPDFKTIKELYGKSKIFWSASGFGENDDKNPEKVEHFGIVVVEAMAAASVPIIYNAGGFKETVTDGKNGYLWNSVSGLTKKTTFLIKHPKDLRIISKNARASSGDYSEERFFREVSALL